MDLEWNDPMQFAVNASILTMLAFGLFVYVEVRMWIGAHH
jgi:hypothetical protein